MRHNFAPALFGIFILFTSHIGWSATNSDLDFKEKMEQTATLLCSNKIKAELEMSDEEFTAFLILAPLEETTAEATLSPCSQEALPQLSHCFLSLAKTQPQSDFGKICYNQVYNTIRIEKSLYQAKIAKATLWQKRFHQNYQRCLAEQSTQKKNRTSFCLDEVAKQYLPQIKTLQKKNLCQDIVSCTQILAPR